MPLDRDLAVRCLKASERLRDLALAGDWPAFEQLLDERSRLLTPLLSADYSAAEADRVRSLIHRIQTFDREAQTLAEESRARVIAEIKEDNQGKKMKAAYGAAKRRY